MDMLLRTDVSPLSAQVAILDATWQGYPDWEDGQEWVAFHADSLIDPDTPPCPGIAVATRGDFGADGPCEVRVEVWSGGTPDGLQRIHQTVLSIGTHGILVGNAQSNDMTELALPEGNYPLQIWVDAETPELVSRVVFLLDSHRIASSH